MDKTLQMYIDKLNALNFKDMYEGDFFLTWDKTDDELEAVFTVADALRYMRENNISTKIFESGLGISLFRDNSTRTRFSFASACNLLGLEVQDLDEGKSQIAHGETCLLYTSVVDSLKMGVTTIFDHHAGFGAIRGSLAAIAEVTQELGIRACLCYEVSDRDGEQKSIESIEENAEFIKWAKAENSEMIKAMFGGHALFTISDKTFERMVKANDRKRFTVCGDFFEVTARSSCCGSFSNRTRFAGLRFGFGCEPVKIDFDCLLQ